MEVPKVLRVVLAVAAAVAPLLGVYLWGWSVRELVILYWFENVIVGFWQLVKMGLAAVGAKAAGCGLVFMMAFFTVHYGGFCAVHGMFVLMLTGAEGSGSFGSPFEMSGVWVGPLMFVGLLVSVVKQAWAVLPVAGLWSLASLFAMRGLGVWQDFVATGKWKEVDGRKLMMEPYKNVVLLHVAIIFGAGLVMWQKNAWPLLGLIVLGKLLLDFKEIWGEARRRENSPVG